MPSKKRAPDTSSPVTMGKVRALLDVDEPNYAEAAKLGDKAIPHLKTLVREGDPMLASKAAYLAGMIQSDRAFDVVKIAAESSDPVVRVAAAAAARNMPDAARDEVLSSLLSDEDPSVRKTALKAAPGSTAAHYPSAEGGPAPPEAGGGSVVTEGSIPGAESLSGDLAGEGGGSINLSTGASTAFGAGEGGGSFHGTLGATTTSGEGGGS